MWPGCRPLRPYLASLQAQKFTRSRLLPGVFDQSRYLYQTRRRPQNAAAAAAAPQPQSAPQEQAAAKEAEPVQAIPYSELTIGVPLEGESLKSRHCV